MTLISVIVGGLAVALPLTLANRGAGLPAGLAISLGALSVARVEKGNNFKERIAGPAASTFAAALAIGVATMLSGHGNISQLGIILTVAASALLVRYSRPMAIGAIRFMLFLVIFGNALENARDVPKMAVAILIGVLWAGLFVMLVGVFAVRRGSVVETRRTRAASPETTVRARLLRMQRELSHREGWDFPFRLGLGLGFAFVARQFSGAHHFSWITVTVALLTPRQFEAWPVRATQRAIGTVLGVALAAILLMTGVDDALLVIVVLVLGSLRKWFEERNYLAYSASMAPLVLLLLSASQGDVSGLLEDRILATFIGVFFVLLTNQIAAKTTMTAYTAPIS